MMNKWDKRFLELAEHVATWSKDPSTKVGAVIVRPDKTIAGVGYNGFPRDYKDTDYRLNNRETKYKYVIHAEANSILSCKEDLTGYTIYVTHPCCTQCLGMIKQKGIDKVVVKSHNDPRFREKWCADDAPINAVMMNIDYQEIDYENY